VFVVVQRSLLSTAVNKRPEAHRNAPPTLSPVHYRERQARRGTICPAVDYICRVRSLRALFMVWQTWRAPQYISTYCRGAVCSSPAGAPPSAPPVPAPPVAAAGRERSIHRSVCNGQGQHSAGAFAHGQSGDYIRSYQGAGLCRTLVTASWGQTSLSANSCMFILQSGWCRSTTVRLRNAGTCNAVDRWQDHTCRHH
jgi:hypothetical protein